MCQARLIVRNNNYAHYVSSDVNINSIVNWYCDYTRVSVADDVGRQHTLTDSMLWSVVYTTGSTLDMSFKLLHEAQSKLKNIIHNRFDSAVRSADAASVERFFKTFPLIGEHKAGLEKFSKYLCTQVMPAFMIFTFNIWRRDVIMLTCQQ